MKKPVIIVPVILLLIFFFLRGRVSGFIQAMENGQTARCWFAGFVVTLLAGCVLLFFLRPQI